MTSFWADTYCKPRFGFPISDWHRAFAWWPVRTFDGRRVWLRSVMRRRYHEHEYLTHPGHAGMDQWWVYATVTK